MKTLIALVLAAALLAPSAPALAQPGRHDGPGDHRGPDNRGGHDYRGPQGHGPSAFVQFRKGERFDRRRAPNYAVVDYHRYRRLGPPPRGYQWVRSGNDAVLVAITTGIVARVIVGAIR
ncbi:RcnB family protein [Novosphingobium sp. SG707]|uniref:RcnB family protein n=1 Tax=Novosphingobium sp. SG707 TaxID=2586996 RepID=UPI001447251C|nr:RcnB family protein [Novosphingobium sp. SG707]NKI99255.1 Ni/Co efflux regulator RcnB [Novosphingobium sp. SG707]